MFKYGKQDKKSWIGMDRLSQSEMFIHILSSSPKGVQPGSYLYCTTFSPQTLMEGFLAFYTYNPMLISSADQPQAPSFKLSEGCQLSKHLSHFDNRNANAR